MSRPRRGTARRAVRGGEARAAAAAILAARDEILELSHRIHANPEPAFEERQAATWVADAVRRHGYEVEHPAGRLETAVRGRRCRGGGGAGAARGSAILAEYDALPGLGHGCGHNTMAASGVGGRDRPRRGRATSCRARSSSSGTPAEERGLAASSS